MRTLLTIALLFLVACGTPDATPSSADPQTQGMQQAVTFAVIGDYGYAGEAARLVSAMVRQWQPDAVLTTGDNNYPNGEAATLDRNIGQYYHPLIAFGPSYQGRYKTQGSTEQHFFPSLGNHDWRAHGASPYMRYFALPGNGRYYEVRRGPVAFFVIDSDPHEPDGISSSSAQAAWLRERLADSDAAWKVVTLHHPPYSSGQHGSSAWMRWPYQAWGAHVVLSGHDHHYERLSAQGLTYIVVGSSGAPLRPVHGRVAGAQTHSLDDIHHGAVRAEASTDTLRLEYHAVHRGVVDTLTLQHRH